ncbi:bacteriophage scaffolding protein D [Salmonella enterica]|nr:bacteriophage scaffolding protein D [Salmonella enterica]
MSQVTEQSVRLQTAVASIKLTQESADLDLTEDDFDFLTSNKVWIATDRSRARRCVEACVYGTLDFVGYPRFPAPVEFIAAVIAYYVRPVNIQTACLIMEGAVFSDKQKTAYESMPSLVGSEMCIIDIDILIAVTTRFVLHRLVQYLLDIVSG